MIVVNRILPMVALIPASDFGRISCGISAGFPPYWLFTQTSPVPRGLGRMRRAFMDCLSPPPGSSRWLRRSGNRPAARPDTTDCLSQTQSPPAARAVQAEPQRGFGGTWSRCKAARKKGSSRKASMAAKSGWPKPSNLINARPLGLVRDSSPCLMSKSIGSRFTAGVTSTVQALYIISHYLLRYCEDFTRI